MAERDGLVRVSEREFPRWEAKLSRYLGKHLQVFGKADLEMLDLQHIP